MGCRGDPGKIGNFQTHNLSDYRLYYCTMINHCNYFTLFLNRYILVSVICLSDVYNKFDCLLLIHLHFYYLFTKYIKIAQEQYSFQKVSMINGSSV